MKQINFRIIELPEYQVLLTKDFENEGERELILSITFFLDGVKAIMSLGYESEEKRDRLFNDFSEEMAQDFINKALNLG